ncbi:hypothetical protein ABE41_018115 [Fictibacillus arsenicus]|uniref:DUF1904 domain-containing protein n=2 Tax=Fictibacillus arsenicus TaxID=255247 RepID=A0A1B1Z959_9BACL|nr:hypothetical protein ABE41_018115 [Fictibacillus arsenicus]
MPFIRFTGFNRETLEIFAPSLIEKIATIANIQKDTIKLELHKTEPLTQSPPSIEILIFPRDQQTFDSLSSLIYEILSKYGYTNVHIFFQLLSPLLYYKNGVSIDESIYFKKFNS